MRTGHRLRVATLSIGLALTPMWTGCNSFTGIDLPDLPEIVLTQVVEGLDQPTGLTSPPGDSRLFVTEQSGRIRIIEDEVLLESPFLDLSALTEAQGEQGLLGLAFHPDYASNGRFFVSYTDVPIGDVRIVEYQVGADPRVANPSSASEILFIRQPGGVHNGGHLEFGPDGMLYIGTGDGGGAYDPFGNGQDVTTLHGGILRLDVSIPGEASIPPDNPFAGSPEEGAEELWAWGLRNPWRFSFDFPSNRLYIADVGQNQWEEMNVIPADQSGANFGWSIMEGPECVDSENCDLPDDLVHPVFYYSIANVVPCAIIGGAVYRGQAIPKAVGQYFYSDFCAGFLKSLRYNDGAVVEERDWDVNAGSPVRSMGRDAAGEIYLLSHDGRVLRMDAGI